MAELPQNPYSDLALTKELSKARNDELQSKNDKLHSQNEGLAHENDGLEKDNKGLEKDKKGLEKDNKNLDGENKKLHKENTKLATKESQQEHAEDKKPEKSTGILEKLVNFVKKLLNIETSQETDKSAGLASDNKQQMQNPLDGIDMSQQVSLKKGRGINNTNQQGLSSIATEIGQDLRREKMEPAQGSTPNSAAVSTSNVNQGHGSGR